MERFGEILIGILKRLTDEDPGEGDRLLCEIQSGAGSENG